ncbi:MAG TPA: hypothetical protein VM662_09270 [Sphingomonas sp.]|nr:hypothetical protein [Sphingomonas sp.]
MRFMVPICAALALIACSERESAKAERQLALVERNSTNLREVCEAKKKVAEAFLKEENAAEYQRTKSDAAITCMRADQEGY